MVVVHPRRVARGPLLLGKLEISPEHGLRSQASLLDNLVDVEEEFRVPSCEICEIALWHGTKVPFDIVRQVLVVVFLFHACQSRSRKRLEETHFVTQGSKKILHRLPIILPEFAQVLDKHLVQPRVPVVPNNHYSILLQLQQVRIFRVSAHDLKPI